MPGLLELQREFAAGLCDRPHDAETWAAGDGIPAAARLRVYRNNARAVFEQALSSTYPVLLRRVGDDYFRQLTHFYRSAHPSRAGDLHEIGRRFPAYLRTHLAGAPYAWLAELATLEWAIAEAGVAADSPVAEVTAFAGVPREKLGSVRLSFVPSLRRVSCTVPALSVWRANQPGAEGDAVDLASGPEHVVIHRTIEGLQLRGHEEAEFAFVGALARGATLEAALDESQLPLDDLPRLLQQLFADGMVAEVVTQPASGSARADHSPITALGT